jgi:two-component system chemotaxis response regulator CheB
MADRRIRVVIVDDSLVAREMLSQILSSDPAIEVVGQAKDGKEGVEMVARLTPDLVTMDIHMPRMDGLAAVEHIMAYTPTPILVVSSSVYGAGTGRAFDALKLGALEVMKKPEPREWEDLQRIGKEIIRKVKMLSRVKVITHLSGRKRAERRPVAPISAVAHSGRRGPLLVAIGSSTGGPSALMTVLCGLPKDFPLPILIAQHIADGCKIKVAAAADDATPLPGHAYLAATGRNLVYDGTAMHFAKPGHGQLYIPSADTLLLSVAESLKARAVGIILTGMGNDGAKGLKAMHDAGAPTIAQDEATSTVWGMPRAAAEMGAASVVLPIESVGAEILRLSPK